MVRSPRLNDTSLFGVMAADVEAGAAGEPAQPCGPCGPAGDGIKPGRGRGAGGRAASKSAGGRAAGKRKAAGMGKTSVGQGEATADAAAAEPSKPSRARQPRGPRKPGAPSAKAAVDSAVVMAPAAEAGAPSAEAVAPSAEAAAPSSEAEGPPAEAEACAAHAPATKRRSEKAGRCPRGGVAPVPAHQPPRKRARKVRPATSEDDVQHFGGYGDVLGATRERYLQTLGPAGRADARRGLRRMCSVSADGSSLQVGSMFSGSEMYLVACAGLRMVVDITHHIRVALDRSGRPGPWSLESKPQPHSSKLKKHPT